MHDKSIFCIVLLYVHSKIKDVKSKRWYVTIESATKYLTIETERLKFDIKLANKSAKEMENKVARLNVKNHNILQIVKNNKAENRALVTEKNKAVKEKALRVLLVKPEPLPQLLTKMQ